MATFPGPGAYIGGLFDPLGALADQDEEAKKAAAPPPSDEGSDTRDFPGPDEVAKMRARAARPAPPPAFRGPPAPPTQAPSRVVAPIPEPVDAGMPPPPAPEIPAPAEDLPAPPIPDAPPPDAPPVDGGGADEPPADAPTPTPAPAAPPKNRDLTYETWLRSHPQAPPKGNLSWLSRGAEDVYSGFMRQKPDYRVGTEMDARTNAENAAGPKSYAQWLQAQKIGSEVAKNDREGVPKPPGDGLAVAGVNAKSRERVAYLNNRMKGIVEEMKVAQGDRKLALQRELGLLNNELKGQMETGRNDRATESNVSHEKVAGDNRAAAEAARVQGDVTKLGAKQTPLAQTFSSFESFKRDYPDAFTGDLSGQSLNWLEKLEASNPLGIPTRGLLPADKQRLDRMQQNFVDVVKRARTGAQANSNEDRTYARILGLDLSAHPEAFPEAIRDFASAFQTQLRSNERSVRPAAVSRFTEGGGVPSSTSAVFQNAPPVEPGHVRLTGSDGTFDVLESDVAEALAETKPDGTPKYKRVP